MMNNGEISITQALNTIQSWMNAGEYDKVIQGCQEILEIEPGNQRALAMMRKAEEDRHAHQTNGQSMPEPEPAPAPAPAPAAQEADEALQEVEDPLKNLQVDEPVFPTRERPRGERRHLFLAMLIPALLVVVIGGGAVWFVANQNRDAEIEDVVETPVETPSNYLADNEERVETLNTMKEVLDAYKRENGLYPTADQVEAVLLASDAFSKIPSDPRHQEFDKSGKVFGYMYAVYETLGGQSNTYILSALFEDSRGFGSAWTVGAGTRNYADYRDYVEDYVVFLPSGENAAPSDPNGPKVKVKR